MVDRGPVARAGVVALTVSRRRIVNLEEVLQKPTEADHIGIEGDLNTFCVGAVIAVRRVRDITAGVAHASRNHPRELAEEILHSPKAASRQNRALSHPLSST